MWEWPETPRLNEYAEGSQRAVNASNSVLVVKIWKQKSSDNCMYHFIVQPCVHTHTLYPHTELYEKVEIKKSTEGHENPAKLKVTCEACHSSF